jgi:hypothetical protein
MRGSGPRMTVGVKNNHVLLLETGRPALHPQACTRLNESQRPGR